MGPSGLSADIFLPVLTPLYGMLDEEGLNGGGLVVGGHCMRSAAELIPALRDRQGFASTRLTPGRRRARPRGGVPSGHRVITKKGQVQLQAVLAHQLSVRRLGLGPGGNPGPAGLGRRAITAANMIPHAIDLTRESECSQGGVAAAVLPRPISSTSSQHPITASTTRAHATSSTWCYWSWRHPSRSRIESLSCPLELR